MKEKEDEKERTGRGRRVVSPLQMSLFSTSHYWWEWQKRHCTRDSKDSYDSTQDAGTLSLSLIKGIDEGEESKMLLITFVLLVTIP